MSIRRSIRFGAVALALVLAVPATPAATGAGLEYEQCYEVVLIRPRPVVLLQDRMPAGFSPAPVIDPTGTMSAFITVGFRCDALAGEVVEVLDLVPVVPPDDLAGDAGNFLLVGGTTSRASSRDAYATWCVPLHHGDARFDETAAGIATAISISAEHPDGDRSIESAVPESSRSRGAAGTLRVISVAEGRAGFFDIAFTAAESYAPVAGIFTVDGRPEPAPAVHIVPADGAPNSWSISGRCA